MILEINNKLKDFSYSDELVEELKAHIIACLEVEDFPKDVEVSMSFVSEEEIRELNWDFRSKDRATDVLSFPSWDEYARILGDVVICPSIAKAQAEEIGNSLDEEITYLTVHSIFHLLGYDHMNEDDKKLMREKEKKALELRRRHERP